MRKFISMFLCAGFILSAFAACGESESAGNVNGGGENEKETTNAIITTSAPSTNAESSTNPESEKTDAAETQQVRHVELVIKDYGTVTIELYPNEAPITVENFISLAEEGFYDGLGFHRLDKDFVLQGGDPEGNGLGGSDTEIKGEFASNGVNNTISHKRGVISMARAQDPNSASSQFFICLEDATFLDGNYAAFGYVIEGMEIIDKVRDETPESGCLPKDQQPIIETIKVID